MEDFLMHTVSPVMQQLLIVLVTLLIGLALNWFKKRTGIDIQQRQMDFVTDAATNAVLKMEGRAMRYLADKGEKWTGAQKHGEAVNKLLSMAPNLTQEQAKHYVDMAVARIPGIGQKDLKVRSE